MQNEIATISFIGAGNVATHLARAFYKSGICIHEIVSRSELSAMALANEVNARAISDIESLNKDSDLYVISVPDNALKKLVKNLHARNALWVHTSGSLPLQVLAAISPRTGVLYPFQTFSKSRIVEFNGVPVFIESEFAEDGQLLKSLAGKITNKVYDLDSENRQWLHLAGIFANNYTNLCLDISYQLVGFSGLSAEVLAPLIQETFRKALEIHPKDAQTGPALRNDTEIMNHHQQLLKDKAELAEMYRMLSYIIRLRHSM